MENKSKRIIKSIMLCTAVLCTAYVLGSCIQLRDQEEQTNARESKPEQTESTVTEQPETENAVQEGVTLPGMQILSSEENSEWVIVETNYGKLQYSAAFSDLIKVKAVNHETSVQLQFLMRMQDTELLVYSVLYNDYSSENRIPFGTLKLADDMGEMEVSVVFEDAPEGLSKDWLTTFCAVQETFNEVIVSMSEDSRFVPAE